jgi:nicotinamide riboside kinase
MLRAGLLHPRVYRDLIPWVAFLGAPSAGKSTITAACAAAFTPSGVFMPEYGREYWEEHAVDRRLSLRQLVNLARGHMEREEVAAARCDGPLFVDTTALTTHAFSLDYHGAAAPELAALAAQAASRYDVVFLCGDDIPYDDTEDRSGPQHRAAFQKRVVADLRARHIPFHPLRGSVEDRVAEVGRVLAARGICVRQQQHQPACEAAGAGVESARGVGPLAGAGETSTSASLCSDSGAAATPASANGNATEAAGATECDDGSAGEEAGSRFRRPAGGHRDAAGKWGSLELERC